MVKYQTLEQKKKQCVFCSHCDWMKFGRQKGSYCEAGGYDNRKGAYGHCSKFDKIEGVAQK